jgi:hypothetical protein
MGNLDSEVDEHVRQWETTRLADQLRWQLGHAWAVIRPNLEGLTDEEYFWEPTHDCWSVRRRTETTAPLAWGKGDWVVENSRTPPSPPPFTTIAWRLLHGYDCLNDFFSRGVQMGLQDWNDIEVPGHAAGAVELMTSLVTRIDETLAKIDDNLLRPRGDGERIPGWALVTFGLHEATHHCAEVGLLRDLFRMQRESGVQ